MSSLVLKPGREKSLLRRHPWVFSGAVARIEGDPQPGESLDILSAQGDFLARAAFSPQSQITARVWTFEPEEAVDAALIARRIEAALALRSEFGFSPVTRGQPGEAAEAYRLIHAESDGLPGLIVDRYGDMLVLQALTAGAERWREEIADALMQQTGVRSIYERSDADVRELEGLAPRVGPLRGSPAERVTITEGGLRFVVDIARGHKTGFYLDQRENRRRAGELARGREVLNCFSYTGGFSVQVLAHGARSVLSVDSSAEALALARENIALNGLPAADAAWLEGDVFQVLRRFRDERRSFDMIVLDPPRFAPTAAQAQKAARGYKDINLLAFKLLRADGLLVTFSCSGGVDAALFQKIVASAALDAGVQAQIVEHLSQPADHPVALNFPEGSYLKGLICRRMR